MIRTVLASPWLPLLYWSAAVFAMICVAHQKSARLGLSYRALERFVTAPTAAPGSTPENSSTSRPHLGNRAIDAVSRTTQVWSPRIFVLLRCDPSVQSVPPEVVTNQSPGRPQSQISVVAPITTLSIRADPPEQTVSKTLAIQCRTSAALNDSQGRTVTIHGIVTQEVVSSSGKILIMAGSRVVGPALLDSENGRFKSDGLWSIFFDNTELRVQAQLLDRPAGLPGLLGQESSDQTLRKENVRAVSRAFFVPQSAPFVLEIHGEILLRDLKSNETGN